MKTTFIQSIKIKTLPTGRSVFAKSILGLTFAVLGSGIQAQTIDSAFIKPSWWFGAAGGANFNFYQGSTQKLNNDLTLPAAFHDGTGPGLFLGPMAEFHRPDSQWGVMLQANYDSRRGKFKEVNSPCNCPMELSTKLSYLSVEPSLRFAPFKSNLYLFAGPRVAFLLNKSFTYQQKANPDYPEQMDSPEIVGDFSDMKSVLVSMQIGAGYDIPLSSKENQGQLVVSPFISYHPYFGQSPRDIETWNISTVRAGVIFKFGKSKDAVPLAQRPLSENTNTLVPLPPVIFTVFAPKNVPVERRVRETFPIRNYVFFDLGSTKIPSRYVTIRKDQVKDFKEDQLEVFKPKRLSGRSNRQMVAYYNILNILGDRMQKNPNTNIVLVGASEKGETDALAMANSIKTYLVDVFSIAPTRITLEGRTKPKHPSEKAGGTKELVLLRQGDRRVNIESNSPSLLMEFQSGSDVPLKPVEIFALQEAPIDSYVRIKVEGATENFSSWRLEIKDDKGKVQNFGSYTQTLVTIPGKTIMGNKPEGTYQIKLIGKTKTGEIITRETSTHMTLWKPAEDEQGMRYSVIFDFNESEATKMYEKYLLEVVAPKITNNANVIIHGHSDIIGDEAYNKKLSAARTSEVREILEKGVKNAGRTNVDFDEISFGEDTKASPFENKYPEERFYNRTVIIDIIPKK